MPRLPGARAVFYVFSLVLLAPAVCLASAGEAAEPALSVPGWLVAPFALLLLSIAVFPLLKEHWWESNNNKLLVAAVLATPVLLYLLFVGSELDTAHNHVQLAETMLEYCAFIALLGSLFVISGGIYVAGDIKGRPSTNTLIIAIGGLLASFIGTTGAAMLLIRPIIRANRRRTKKTHIIVFFIFVVANCGGLLTPLGDPPLFLGFLKGVPFMWTFSLWREWAFVIGSLLVLFYFIDRFQFRRDETPAAPLALDENQQPQAPERLGIRGGFNFVLLGGVIVTVVASSFVNNWYRHARYVPALESHTREVLKGDPETRRTLESICAALTARERAAKPGAKEVSGEESAENHDESAAHEEVFDAYLEAEAKVFAGLAKKDIPGAAVIAARLNDDPALADRLRLSWLDFEWREKLWMEFVVKGFQVALMAFLAWVSMATTSQIVRKDNEFSWHAIQEVAYLFIGIFITMIPALIILNARGEAIVHGILGSPDDPVYGGDQAKYLAAQLPLFFWITGALSSFLDNAPTYLVFLATAQGLGEQGVAAADVTVRIPNALLAAVSCGAVFMGANTYIGNGPNFMVKAIAEEARIRMPSFFGYMLWSGLILIPLLVAVTFIFF